MSRGALSLDRQCQLAGIPKPVGEHRFHPIRKWRLDWAWPDYMLAIEIDGAVFTSGRHTRGAGVEADMEKLNEAMCCGWTVLRVSSRHVRDGRALGWIERMFIRAGGGSGC